MTMQQNQGRSALPNVLHDQGVANTLSGIGLPRKPANIRVSVVAMVATVAGLVALLAILVRGAT